MREWPETPNLWVLRERLPVSKELLVSFVTLDGIERAVWDNGCYYEPFRFDPGVKRHDGIVSYDGDWVVETDGDAEAWSEDMEEAYGEACIHLGELGTKNMLGSSVWIARSDLDGYFVSVFVSPRGDVDRARTRAWEIYTGPNNRPEVDLPSSGAKPGWTEYHTDPRGISVFDLGDGYVGSDGEGHLEVDDAVDPTIPWDSSHPGAAMRCEERHPKLGRCVLPIGHGTDFPHDWAELEED